MLMQVNPVPASPGQAASFHLNAGRIRHINLDAQGTVLQLGGGTAGGGTLTVSQELQDFLDQPGMRRVNAWDGHGFNVMGVNLAHVARIEARSDGRCALHFADGAHASPTWVNERIDYLLGDDIPEMLELSTAEGRVAVNLAHVLDVNGTPNGSLVRMAGPDGAVHGDVAVLERPQAISAQRARQPVPEEPTMAPAP